MDIVMFLKAMGNLAFATIVFLAMFGTTLFYFLAYFIAQRSKAIPARIVRLRKLYYAREERESGNQFLTEQKL